MISVKLDPCNSISEHTILADVRRLAFMKCKDLPETKLRILQLINLCNEFCDKTGKEVDGTEKTFAIWLFLDEESRLKAERKGLVEGTTPFSEVCDFLDQISSDEGNRRAIAEYAKTQAPVKMDLSALERAPPGAASAELPPVAPEPGASLDAFEGKCHKCEGTGHRQADCPSRPEVQLSCNKCGGWGHYANECPSKGEGKGKGKDEKGGKGKGDFGKGGKGWDGGKGWGGKDGGKGWGGKDGGKGWNGGYGGKSGNIKGKGKGKGGKGKGKGGVYEFAAGSEWDHWGSEWQGHEWQGGDWNGTNSLVPSDPWMRRLCPLTEVLRPAISTSILPSPPHLPTSSCFFSYFSVDYVFNSNTPTSTDIVVCFYFSHSIADHVDKIQYR